MRKNLTRLLRATCILLCLFSDVNAQVSDSFYLRMSHIFQHVEPARVTTGLLKDYGIDFTKIQDYDGVQVTDTNIVYGNTWDDLYTSLYTYRFNNVMAAMSHPDTVFNAIWDAQTSNLVPLSLLLMRYDSYRDDALSAGLVTVTGDQIYDKYVSGVWQNPYQQKVVMGVRTGANNILRKKSMVFRLPATLLYSNFSNIQSIQADFADGLGWRTITTNTDIPVSYADTGRKVLQFRVTLTTSQQYVSRSAIGVYPEDNTSGTARFLEHLRIPIAANATHSGGTLQVHFSSANVFTQRITRPLIIAEGFDPWRYTSKDSSDNTDFDDFWRLRGEYGFELRQLLSEDYDIIYLDYKDGTDEIGKNAALMRAAIAEVNVRKAAAGSVEPNVVLGISMGGLVARMALRQMELNAQPHQTRLFVSLDAPYQGANVPLGLQALNAHLANTQIKVGLVSGSIGYVTTVGSLAKALKVYSSPAAKQLLTYYVKSNLPTGNLSMDNTVHNSFVNTLKSLGYPINCRNVAISNGSECATSLPVSPGSDLMRLSGHYGTTVLGALAMPMIGITPGTLTNYPQFLIDFFPGPSAIKCNFVVRTTPASGSTQVYNGRVWLEKKIFFFITVNQTLTSNSYNSPSGILPLDAYPGGQYAVNEVGQVILENFDGDFGTSFWQEIQSKMMKRGISEFYMASPSFTFTPTPHVLDIGQSNVTLAASDYTTQYRATAPPAAPKNTPFANFLTAFNNGDVRNENHVDIRLRSGDWFAAELNAFPIVGDCGAFCNRTVTGPEAFCNSQIYSVGLSAGTIVNWQVNPAGIVNLAPAGSQVTLTRVTAGPITLTANIAGACGNFTIQKIIDVGTASPEWINGYREHSTGKIIASVTAVPGATSYNWYLNNVLRATTTGTATTFSTPRNACDTEWDLAVEAVGPCGTSVRNIISIVAPPCLGLFTVSPNPAKNLVVIEAESPEQEVQAMQMKRSAQNTTVEQIAEVRLVDLQGRVLQQQKYGEGNRRVSMDVATITPGSYILMIFNGRTWTSRQLVIVR